MPAHGRQCVIRCKRNGYAIPRLRVWHTSCKLVSLHGLHPGRAVWRSSCDRAGRNAMPTREEIKKDIVDELFWDGRVNAADILVEFKDGTVVLEGAVPNYRAKQAAEADARAIPGVHEIENRIQVRYPEKENVPGDVEIAGNIRSVLLWDPHLDANQMMVSVDNGEARLSGSVDAYWKKKRAEEIAFDVIGITAVHNELSVVPTHDIADQTIADDIMSALSRTGEVAPEAIRLGVSRGIVTLSGSVGTWGGFLRAQEVASVTPGVVDVVNRLNIQ